MNKIILKLSILLISALTLITSYSLYVIISNSMDLVKIILIYVIILIITLIIISIIYTLLSKDTKVRIITSIIIVIPISYFLLNTNNTLNQTINNFDNMNSRSQNEIHFNISPSNDVLKGKNDIDNTTIIGTLDTSRGKSAQYTNELAETFVLASHIKTFENTKDAYKALMRNEIDILLTDNSMRLDLKKIDSSYDLIENSIYSIVMKNTDLEANQPVTILLSGIDSRSNEIEDISNSDSNIIITYDPVTNHITTLSTPRDSRVTIMCGGFGLDKLTHAASYGGTDCVKATLENLYEVEINYSVRINFIGLIDIVDALGGIYVDIPTNQLNYNNEFCEQNSHGKKDKLCFTEGEINHLDGEHALAFARNRYNQDGGDLYRGRNQQIVIEAIIDRISTINSFDTINKLINAAGENVATNLSPNDIIKLFDGILSSPHDVYVEKLFISGDTPTIDGISYVTPYISDIEYATYRMKVNLGIQSVIIPSNEFEVFGQKPRNIEGSNPLEQQRTTFTPSTYYY